MAKTKRQLRAEAVERDYVSLGRKESRKWTLTNSHLQSL